MSFVKPGTTFSLMSPEDHRERLRSGAAVIPPTEGPAPDCPPRENMMRTHQHGTVYMGADTEVRVADNADRPYPTVAVELATETCFLMVYTRSIDDALKLRKAASEAVDAWVLAGEPLPIGAV